MTSDHKQVPELVTRVLDNEIARLTSQRLAHLAKAREKALAAATESPGWQARMLHWRIMHGHALRRMTAAAGLAGMALVALLWMAALHREDIAQDTSLLAAEVPLETLLTADLQVVLDD